MGAENSREGCIEGPADWGRGCVDCTAVAGNGESECSSVRQHSGKAMLQSGGKKVSKARKKKAVVAVARKLAALLHRLWVTGKCTIRNTTAKRHRQPRAKAKQHKGLHKGLDSCRVCESAELG